MAIRFIALYLLASVFLHGRLIWPTPNPAFECGEPIESYVQATASEDPRSGLFGCVRNGGHSFHEGLDLYPIRRDSRGNALDTVFSILPGRVVYVNRIPAHSSYGNYVVVQHKGDRMCYHSLYAHLASVDDGIETGVPVESGTVLGIMGRSASYPIPKHRAHLHFEIGVRLTDDFQRWYDRQNFESQNRHGIWNGMNLAGIDPKSFYEAMKTKEVRHFYDHFRRLPIAARIRVYTREVPDFVKNHPVLLTRPYEGRTVIAWTIAFTRYGVPKEWTPHFTEESSGASPEGVEIVAYNPQMIRRGRNCCRVLDIQDGRPRISARTMTTLEKLFDLKKKL